MRNKKNLILGLVPTQRDADSELFGSQIVQERKRQLEQKLDSMGISYVNIDFLNPQGTIRKAFDAEKVAQYLSAQGVDALFCPHLNFGSEAAVAKVGKLMNKPLLLWGMRDDAPDANGARYTDSQCGLFVTGKVLNEFGVPFTYMTNCTLDDPTFERVLRNFLGAAQVVKAFRGMRIGQISTRPDAFWSVKCNELELLERFSIEVVPTSLIDIQNSFDSILKNEQPALQKEVERYKEEFNSRISDDALLRAAALKETIRRWAEEQNLDGIASFCWDAMRQVAGISCCFTFAELTGEGLPVVCETDVHGAITSVMAQAATMWQKPSFFADLTICHPYNDNAELLWHCGVFPAKIACKECKPGIGCSYDQNLPGVGNFKLEEGEVTICRFDGMSGHYQLFTAQGHSVDGPATHGTYGWYEFENWPRIEHKLVCGPYVHHCAGIHAHIAPVLYEACRYIPGLEPDPISPGRDEIEAFLI